MTVVQLARRPAGWLLRARRALRAPPLTASAALVVGVSGALLVFGLIMILSSSWVAAYQRYGSSYLFFSRQLVWAAIGISAMLAVSLIDYRRFRLLAYALLAAALAGLVLVLIPGVGTVAGGASRWLSIGPARFQPSEFAKLALVLVGADLCVRKRSGRLRSIRDVMLPLGAIASVLGLLVLMQPDLGTTLILIGITFVVLFVGGARLRVLACLGSVGAGGTVLLSLSEGYRRARLFSFLNPFRDPLNTGYQAVQGQIALGSGGLFGVGLGASRQKWEYVPNAHTDFIFAIVGEEAGLVGTFAVIVLIALLGYTGVRVARRAPDAFGRVVASGITGWIVGQAIVNMSAVTGLLPITGVPLPLVSFGGSSLLFTLVGLGILVNIARQERWPPRTAEVPAAAAPERRERPARSPAKGRADAAKRRRRAPPARARRRG